jgi:GTPase
LPFAACAVWRTITTSRNRFDGYHMSHTPQQNSAETESNAVVVRPVLRPDDPRYDEERRLAEAVKLAASVGLQVVHAAAIRVRAPTAPTLLGEGQVGELAGIVAAANATVAVVDATLNPTQQRNLEQRWNCKVIDRTAWKYASPQGADNRR